MLTKYAFYSFGGFSLIYIFGMLALLSIVATMSIPLLRERGWTIKFVWHWRLVWLTICFLLVHVTLALSVKYGW